MASLVIAGNSIRPPMPVHLSARRDAAGNIAIGWVRRSRIGWVWSDGGDIPLGEESEAWRVVLTPDAGNTRTVETGSADLVYTLAEQEADGLDAATSLSIAVVQLGTLASSSPAAEITINL